VFTFSEEMFPILPLALPGFTAYLEWTGLGASPVQYSWDGTSTILTCSFSQNLPGNTQIGWTLNPPGVPDLFQLTSLFGEVLPNTSGSFTTGEGQTPCDPDGIPDSYGSVVLQKYSAYTQTSSATPNPSAELPHVFATIVKSPTVDAVSAASLEKPGGNPEPMASMLGIYSLSEDYPSQTELDAAHPGGTYRIEVTQLIAGASTVSLALPAGFPPIPQVANYPATQAVDPNTDFTLTWDAFSDATEDDAIALRIHDALFETVFEAPDICAGIDLMNSDTSITIPGGTFQTGQTYVATLTFSRVFHRSTDTLQNFGVFGSVFRSTEFTIIASNGTGVPQPRISGVTFPTGGSLAFTATDLQPGSSYAVEISPTAEPGSWTELSTFTAAGTQTPITDTTAERTGPRFYRVKAQSGP
jgi:hypothetical protein